MRVYYQRATFGVSLEMSTEDETINLGSRVKISIGEPSEGNGLSVTPSDPDCASDTKNILYHYLDGDTGPLNAIRSYSLLLVTASRWTGVEQRFSGPLH